MKRTLIKKGRTYFGKNGDKKKVVGLWQSSGTWNVNYALEDNDPKDYETLRCATLDNFAQWAVRVEKKK